MIEKARFMQMLARRARVADVKDTDVLFGSGLDISSIAFTEFIMEIEEEIGVDIDPDELDVSIKTAGQLYEKISDIAP